MKDSGATLFFGLSFFLMGALCVIISAIISNQKHTDFIHNEEIFRVVIIGLVLFVGGSLALCIHRVQKMLEKSILYEEKK